MLYCATRGIASLAEWSKALRSGRSLVRGAQVRILQLAETFGFPKFHAALSLSDF